MNTSLRRHSHCLPELRVRPPALTQTDLPRLTLLLMMLGLVALASAGVANDYGPAPYYHNLLVNPNGDDGDLSGWTITENGGNGWRVSEGSLSEEEHDNGFLTSYNWARREQTIDLIAEGFSATYLDAQPPIIISEVFQKIYCADHYSVAVDLLDSNRNVVHTWDSGERIHGDASCDYSGYKEQVSMQLMHYGSGVRFIRWRDGGKSSEYWSGHYGTKLQNAYLALAPANLLNNPDSLSSWTILENGGDRFRVAGPSNAREFLTSYRWSRRQQIVDLRARGFTTTQLDSGDLPIYAGGSYGMVGCPDQYYLKVELLDAAMQVVESYDSGVLRHDADCDFSYGEYREIVLKVFEGYDPGVRFIRWEDGGRDTEGWLGHYGARLGDPYLGIVNHDEEHAGSDRLVRNLRVRDFWPTMTVGGVAAVGTAMFCLSGVGTLACLGAAGAAAIVTVSTVPFSVMNVYSTPPEHVDERVAVCGATCKLDKIKVNLDPRGLGKTWAEPEMNDSIEILARPRKSTSASNLNPVNNQFLSSVRSTVSGGREIIDITTLARIDGTDWRNGLASALRDVERASGSASPAPVVRVYLGLSGFFTGWPDYFVYLLQRLNILGGFAAEGIREVHWNGHFRELLDALSANLVGNTGMEIYISGSRNVNRLNWNHSKIVSADGRQAIVGGHNLWHEYFDSKPIFDTSVRVNGNSARMAHNFVDELWQTHLSAFGSQSHVLRWSRGSVQENVTSVPMAHDRLGPGPGPSGSIRVLAVGQLGDPAYPSPLKKAVLSMLEQAEHTISASQQSLAHPFAEDQFSVLLPTVDGDVAEVLTRKAIEGVRVEVVTSNPNAPHDTKSNISNSNLIRAIWQAAVQRGVDSGRSAQRDFCDHFSIYNLRVDKTAEAYPGSSESFANHSKSVMVDKELFMIGSHNLYVQAPTELSEFAYFVANSSEARKYYNNYWQPVLDRSKRTDLGAAGCLSALGN